jgi:hypothetical protein
MRDGFITSTELTGGSSLPVSLQQIVFCSNGIMPNHPQPNFDFQRDSAIPEMFK